MLRTGLAVTLLFWLTACAVNPVTGERGLNFYGEDWELEVGEQQYAPMRQSQGGDFVLDAGLVDYVQSVGQRVASEADRTLPYEFHVINSSVPNAWALPAGKIVVNRGLLTELGSEAELAAVLGHEVTHAAASHSAQAASRAALTQGAVMVGAVAVGMGSDNSDYSQIAMLGGMLGAQLVQQRHSRGAEREADYYGMHYMKRAGYNPEAAVELQKTFVRLSEGQEAGWLDGLFASHPPSRERVENNARTADELGREGRMGKAEYQQKMSILNRLEPAYKAYDEGQKALAEERFDVALGKADEALAISRDEALFHALKGDALAGQKKLAAAESAFSDALARDSGWFYYHLRRGNLREQAGNLKGARSDLRASLERLQTADAHFLLGNVERSDGNRNQAIEHYRVAAQSDSRAGQLARQQLAEMGVSSQ